MAEICTGGLLSSTTTSGHGASMMADLDTYWFACSTSTPSTATPRAPNASGTPASVNTPISGSRRRGPISYTARTRAAPARPTIPDSPSGRVRAASGRSTLIAFLGLFQPSNKLPVTLSHLPRNVIDQVRREPQTLRRDHRIATRPGRLANAPPPRVSQLGFSQGAHRGRRGPAGRGPARNAGGNRAHRS